ncbi:MAG TPA: hypothetical protein VL989_02845 [Candidatus Sulfotelmatobacter sp.]|nr:hypothetical protein [Candidatus Sulfotelmatobacter sp.]
MPQGGSGGIVIKEGWPTDYNEIFERQGIPEALRNYNSYFFYRVTAEDSKNHEGELYAMPRDISAPERYEYPGLGEKDPERPKPKLVPYRLFESGAVIALDSLATVTRVSLGPRTVLEGQVRALDADIGSSVIVGANSIIENSTIRNCSEIGEDTLIRGSKIGFDVSVGKNSQVRASRVGDETMLGERSRLEQASVGLSVIIGDGVDIWRAQVDNDVEICHDSVIYAHAHIGEGSYVLPRVSVEQNRKIKPGSVVVKRGIRKRLVTG